MLFLCYFLLRNPYNASKCLKTFFQRILKNFLLVVWRIRDYFSFGIGVGGQDSILNFSIWRPESENRSKMTSVLIRNRKTRVPQAFPHEMFLANLKKTYLQTAKMFLASSVNHWVPPPKIVPASSVNDCLPLQQILFGLWKNYT